MTPDSLRRLQDMDVRDKRVLVRVDFNVPLQDGAVLDDGRVRASLPTVRELLDRGATVALCSHLGRPKGVDDRLRLAPVAERLGKLLGQSVQALPDCVGDEVAAAVRSMEPGEVALLENLRFHPGEKQDDPEFARQLAEPFDLFVQDAFGSVHRAHASTHAVTQHLPSAAGLLIQQEVEQLGKLIDDPAHPFVALVGGKKAEEKVGGLFDLLGRVDTFLIGGGVAFTFLAARGASVGRSIVADDLMEEAKRFVKAAYERGATVVLPSDVQAAERLEEGVRPAITRADRIPDDLAGFDIGPETARDFRRRLQGAETVFWAGPMGAFEFAPFDKGTLELARAVADSGAFAVIGGGETGAAFARAGIESERVYVSTGGGASVEFVGRGTLPGLEVLKA